ncbi:NAD(P)/FAD-dependent oxidoreductase [Pseudonocardia sp. CA-107938]|uniref:NAD(P)/FAD-dependent oxidoreductase n=1 Tax=Pseudonocardia sp. CA-107938 TaxID=3240021 RepID=UPI003D93B544
MRDTVAVVGSGVAGLTAAHLLQRRYDVTLFEADHRLGGHAHTHELPGPGGTVRVDSGFIVHNERTYPNLLRLFGELGVATQAAEMSMSVRCRGCGLEYAGGRRLGGLFATPSTARRPAYLRMLVEVGRFHRHARRVLADERAADVTLGAFVAIGGHSRFFVEHFLLPVVACVWSADELTSLRYPARYLFTFLDHHGMLAVGGSPQWRTVVGGSRSYVERAVKGLTAVHVATPVRALRRLGRGVEVRDDADTARAFDRVVIATHPAQALALWTAPTPAEVAALGPITYAPNVTQLHRDTSLLPRAPRARASWNYLKLDCASNGSPVLVSYDMNRLHRLDTAEPHVVTLNGAAHVEPSSVLATMQYAHPRYTPESVAAQRLLPALNDGTVAYAGAYHGWGFHEDGCAAGVRAAASLGVSW